MSGGTKYDSGKAPISLIPNDALIEIARVMEYGSRKYARHNWTKGFEWSRLIDSTYRHLGEWKESNSIDPESGLSHLSHAACNLIFLISHEVRNLGKDDRHKWEQK